MTVHIRLMLLYDVRNTIEYHKIIVVRESHVKNNILQKHPALYYHNLVSIMTET